MLECKHCGKTFKLQGRLDNHVKKYHADAIEDFKPHKGEPEPMAPEHPKFKQARKLRDAIRACLDAETRYKLEQELKELLK